jgi:lysozyme
LIKGDEGCELEAYPDPGSPLGRLLTSKGLPMRRYEEIPTWQAFSGHPWTCGWGSTAGVYPGMRISQIDAEARFVNAMKSAASQVLHAVGATELTQNQLDALTSLVYNLGIGKAVTSGIIGYVISGNRPMLERLWLSLDHAGGVQLPGLVKRRAAEVALFFDT